MKYTIETTDTGCIETIQTERGTFSNEWVRIGPGRYTCDAELVNQMESAGSDDDTLDMVCDLYDGNSELDFMRIAKAAERF